MKELASATAVLRRRRFSDRHTWLRLILGGGTVLQLTYGLNLCISGRAHIVPNY
jgi:hypothetical protein